MQLELKAYWKQTLWYSHPPMFCSSSGRSTSLQGTPPGSPDSEIYHFRDQCLCAEALCCLDRKCCIFCKAASNLQPQETCKSISKQEGNCRPGLTLLDCFKSTSFPDRSPITQCRWMQQRRFHCKQNRKALPFFGQFLLHKLYYLGNKIVCKI